MRRMRNEDNSSLRFDKEPRRVLPSLLHEAKSSELAQCSGARETHLIQDREQHKAEIIKVTLWCETESHHKW